MTTEARMETGHKNCQSCGMPLSRDARGGGTNADGSKSRIYCSHCFAAGRFTLPDITAEQMQDRVRDELRERGIPRVVSWVFTRKIPKLQRWSGGRAGTEGRAVDGGTGNRSCRSRVGRTMKWGDIAWRVPNTREGTL